MKKLIILVGNIGSGKSTLAKDYQKDDYIIIARDQLRYAIGGGFYIFNEDYEHIIFRTEMFMLKKFLELGVNILVDEVGVTKLMRERYITLAKEYKYKITIVEMPKLNKKESVDRRMKNPHDQMSRKLWESVWDRFNNKYESPSKEEGVDEVIRLQECK